MGIYYGKADFINYGKPSLLLDFANKKSLTDRISGNNLFTFTRTSTGTYVGSDGLIKSAAVNEARFDHNPVTGESLGLLIEEQRANLITPSNIGNTLLNDGGGVTLSTDTTIPTPLGDFSGVLKCIHTTNTPGYFRRGQNLSLTAGVTYTFSFFFRNGTVVSPYGQNPINFGILASTYSPTFQELSTSLNTNIPYPNGWYRQVFTFTSSYTQTYQVDFNQANNQTALGTYYLYGFQLEQGSFPTSYIPTTGSQVTRNADSASITGTNLTSFYNQSQGTLFCRFRNFGYGNAYHAGGGGVSFDNSGPARPLLNLISLNMRRDGPFYRNGALILANNTTFASAPTTSGPSNNINDTVNYYNFVGSFSASRRAFTYNGITPGVDTASIVMPTISRFIISTNSNYLYDAFTGYISKISYYPSQLIETQLESLTR